VARYSAEFNRMLGLPPADTSGPLSVLLDRVHPEDQADVRGAIGMAEDGAALEVEFRVVRPGGDRRLRCQVGEAGATTGTGPMVVATAQEVTERRRLETEL
jgi:PAS domain-containing protein